MCFRFEWFEELDGYDYEVPSGFRVFDPVEDYFGDGSWVKAPHHCNLGDYLVEGVDEEVTGENFLNVIQGAPSKNFLVLYDEHGFVLLSPPEGYELEEALPSNPPTWLKRIRGQLEGPRKTFWERL